AKQDWCFLDTEDATTDAFDSPTTQWYAFAQELIAVNMRTGQFLRLAHHRSRSPLVNYYWQPRVSASWNGFRVGWLSNFNVNEVGYSDIYFMGGLNSLP